jgi:hypothetical protein
MICGSSESEEMPISFFLLFPTISVGSASCGVVDANMSEERVSFVKSDLEDNILEGDEAMHYGCTFA